MRNAWTLPARIKGLTLLTLGSTASRLMLDPTVIKIDVEGRATAAPPSLRLASAPP